MFEIFESIREMFYFPFIVNAIIVGTLISICAALLGVSLVLKRYSMIGVGLSNVGFGSLVVATVISADLGRFLFNRFNIRMESAVFELVVVVLVVIAAAIFLLRLNENNRIKGDSAVALVSVISLAIGWTVISKTTGVNTDVCNFLFGSIFTIRTMDVYLSIALSVVVLVLFVLFYNKLFAVTFDETFAKTAGVNTGLYNMLIAVLTALTIVLGMRMMGSMLVSSLIIFPALTSMRLFKKFKSVTICSAIIAILSFFIGVFISFEYNIQGGASVVLVHITVFAVFWLIDIIRSSGMIKKISTAAVLTVIFSLAAITNAGAWDITEGNTGYQKITVQRNIIEIRERMFVTQVNDVYLNAQSYMGRTIKLEGIFLTRQISENESIHYVIRYAPDGCCGGGGMIGFEVKWANSRRYPENNSWVEATGVLKEYRSGPNRFLYLELSSLNVLETRGMEFVRQ